jgi:hypothetical protein
MREYIHVHIPASCNIFLQMRSSVSTPDTNLRSLERSSYVCMYVFICIYECICVYVIYLCMHAYVHGRAHQIQTCTLILCMHACVYMDICMYMQTFYVFVCMPSMYACMYMCMGEHARYKLAQPGMLILRIYVCISMYVCICMYVIYVCMHVHVHGRARQIQTCAAWNAHPVVCMHVCMYVCMYVYEYVYVFVCMPSIYACMYMCMGEHARYKLAQPATLILCMYVCMYVCM